MKRVKLAIPLLACACGYGAPAVDAAPVVVQGGVYEIAAPDATAGSGEIAGGAYRALVAITSGEGAGTIAGGDYEVTGGLERRRPDTRTGDVFADGFE